MGALSIFYFTDDKTEAFAGEVNFPKSQSGRAEIQNLAVLSKRELTQDK